MSGPQVLYNLFWCTQPRETEAAVSTGAVSATLHRPAPHEALILYPAFLTPAVCNLAPASTLDLPAAGEDFFEMLVLAPKGPELTPEIVNRHLKISTGLDAEKWATPKPLFAQVPTSDLLDVKKVEGFDPAKILRTDQKRFRGVVDERFWDAMKAWEKERARHAKARHSPPPPALDTLYQVRIDVSCIASAGPPPDEIARLTAKLHPLSRENRDLTLWSNIEPQDGLILDVLKRKYADHYEHAHGGEPLASGNGFHVSPGPGTRNVDLSFGSTENAVRAYHPLFVFRGLEFAALGHVADLHFNARQNYLAKTTARVVDGNGQTDARASPDIGRLVNIYSDNVLSILSQLGAPVAEGGRGIDVLLVGGDLIDHVINAHPHGKRDAARLREPELSPAEVWDLVGLDQDDDDRNTYQPWVDHLTFFSVMRCFCATYQRPAFVVSGNHDAYLKPYGISPRLAGKRNEGIPADHNLTFYEALLAFGESYGETATVDAINLHEDLFEWFYSVFTPFRDFAVDLPKQRVVGLAWGDNEGKVWGTDAHDAHGIGHLPRAELAATEQQVEVLEEALKDKAKRVVLSTHFTFVSYKNELKNLPTPCAGLVRTGTYSKQDWGTFEQRRKALYTKIHSATPGGPGKGPLLHCVFTGHSHRKGLYFLSGEKDHRTILTLSNPLTPPKWSQPRVRLIPGGPVQPMVVSEDEFPTKMYPLRELTTPPWAIDTALAQNAAATPIIVSDSAGPLPRMNIEGEFGEWGSDQPAGTFVKFDSTSGVVQRVEPVFSDRGNTKPRAVVAIDYLHVILKRGIMSILSSEFDLRNPATQIPHRLDISFHKEFPTNRVRVSHGALHSKAGSDAPFVHLELEATDWGKDERGNPLVTLNAKPGVAGKLFEALSSHKTLLILSLWFMPNEKTPDASAAFDPKLVGRIYEFHKGGTWDFEVQAQIFGGNGSPPASRFSISPKMEPPNFAIRARYFPDRYEKK